MARARTESPAAPPDVAAPATLSFPDTRVKNLLSAHARTVRLVLATKSSLPAGASACRVAISERLVLWQSRVVGRGRA